MQATYISSNQFKVSADKTEEFLAGRRIRALCGSGYKYSTILSSTYSSPDTTITIDETILTSDLSEVHYGIVNIGEQGSFPKHSHDGSEGTGGSLSLLTLSDTPDIYEEGEYLRSTTSGVEWTIPEAEAVVVRIKEENVSAITKGQVCAIVGSSGALAEIGLCDCEDPDKIRIVGIAQADIVQNENGIVVYKGIITGVDTSITNTDVNPNGETWEARDLLWVSNTPGGMTKVRPISGRGIKAARTVKGNSTTDVLIAISHENTIWSTAAAGEDVVLRVGDSVGANKVSIREYTNSEVAAFDSYGNLTLSGTVDGVDIATLQTNIDGKIEWFLTEGAPSAGTGKLYDVAINKSIGTIYKKEPEYVYDSGTFYPAVGSDDGGTDWGTFSNNQVFLGIGIGSGQQREPFIRFSNIIIPNGVTITEAFVRLTAYQSDTGVTCNVKCHLNDHDNAVAPIDLAEFDTLAFTPGIDWNNLSSWVDNTTYDTPSMVSEVQSIVDRGGWSSGNAMMVVIKNNGSSSNTNRMAASVEHASGSQKAELYIEWYLTAGIPNWTEELSPDFLKLSDTPDSYSGIEGNYLRTTANNITTTSGVVLTAPDSSEWRICVTNSGTLYTTAV